MPSTSADPSRPPPEILNFIEKQEGYIEQLERESQFCRVSRLCITHRKNFHLTFEFPG